MVCKKTQFERKDNCQECARNDLYEWLEELSDEVPMPENTGFGRHEEWVQGMLSGLNDHIKGTIASLKQMEKDGLADGTIYEGVKKDE